MLHPGSPKTLVNSKQDAVARVYYRSASYCFECSCTVWHRLPICVSTSTAIHKRPFIHRAYGVRYTVISIWLSLTVLLNYVQLRSDGDVVTAASQAVQTPGCPRKRASTRPTRIRSELADIPSLSSLKIASCMLMRDTWGQKRCLFCFVLFSVRGRRHSSAWATERLHVPLFCRFSSGSAFVHCRAILESQEERCLMPPR